jgi:hypothetical protein
LEILLGAKPDAAIDESMKEQVEKEAERLERKDRISKAGGRLLGASFQASKEERLFSISNNH